MTEKQNAKLEQENLRVAGLRAFEQEAAGQHGKDGLICGIDEAGRGPLAGPVAAGAVILPADHEILWLNDSKKLSPKKRDMLYDQIREEALAWAVVMIGPDRIDRINILQADYEAMRLAVQALQPSPSVLLNDAVTIPGLEIPQVPIIKGDAKCLSIAAASILAKVTRDRYMEQLDSVYPGYGFAGHKGYGTKQHTQALRELGPCPAHRRSFIGNYADLSAIGPAEDTQGVFPMILSGGCGRRPEG